MQFLIHLALFLMGLFYWIFLWDLTPLVSCETPTLLLSLSFSACKTFGFVLHHCEPGITSNILLTESSMGWDTLLCWAILFWYISGLIWARYRCGNVNKGSCEHFSTTSVQSCTEGSRQIYISLLSFNRLKVFVVFLETALLWCIE